MKLLMLTDRMDIGGAETHIFDLCRALLKGGHSVHLLCGGGRYAELLEKDGVRVFYAPLHLRTPSAIVRCAAALSRVCREGNFDLLHAHTRYTAVLASATVPNIPLCVTAHLPFITHGWHRFLCRWGDVTLAVSRDIAEYLVREYKTPISRIFPTRNGIDSQRFGKTAPSEHSIVHVSRLDEGRAATAEALLKIAPRLLSEHPEYTLRIVGDGNQMEKIRALADKVNRTLSKEAVVLTGAVCDVPRELRRAGIFVGVSRALLEAMSMGLPAILAGDEGFGGIVDEERFHTLAYSNFCGRECGALTEEALYESLHTLICDGELRERLGSFGARIIREEYSTERMAEDALSAYRYLLSKSVLIVGYYGYGNLGDELTLSVLKEELARRGIQKITVIGRKSETKSSCRFIGRSDVFRIHRALCSADTVIFGGGNLLQNETSNRSLYYYGALIRIAKRYKKHLIMLSAGVGRVTGYRQLAYTERLLSRFDEVYLRTPRDVKLSREVFHLEGASYSPDLVFRLPVYEGGERCEIGIILHGNKQDKTREAYLETLHRHGITLRYIVLFPEYDLSLTERLASIAPGEIYTPTDFETARDAFSPCKYTVSERLHGGILSLLFGCECSLREDFGKCTALAELIQRLGREHGIEDPLDLPLLPFSSYAELPLKQVCDTIGTREHGKEDGTPKKNGTDREDGTASEHKKSEPDKPIGFAKWINWILKESTVDPFASLD